MNSGFDPGALLARSYALPRGPRVTLRLARIRDLDGIERLLRRQGHTLSGLELARVVHADPRRRLAICATALLGSAETIVGLGVIELDGAEPDPSWIVVDEDATDGLEDLLRRALIGRARALSAGRAA